MTLKGKKLKLRKSLVGLMSDFEMTVIYCVLYIKVSVHIMISDVGTILNDIYLPIPGNSSPSECPTSASFLLPATPKEQAAFFTGLRRLYPKAAVLTATFLQPDTQSRLNAQALHQLQATISTLYHPKYTKLSRNRLLAECEKVFQEMKSQCR